MFLGRRARRALGVAATGVGVVLIAGVAWAAWTSTGVGAAASGATSALALTTVDAAALTSAQLYPGGTGDVLVRVRVDGALEELGRFASDVAAPMVSRLKVLARMNIVERRRPQDGQFAINAGGREVDVRLATVATLYGEKAVMRDL